ncbi:MAG: TonB-dependent receptor [Deltaproteobacteria bacterium]|nr:TonB-dependent receptor [Deltaproteobacteria bacterium]
MRSFTPWAAALAIVALLCFPVPSPAAPQTNDADKPAKSKSIGLGDIVVRGQVTSEDLQATSATVLDNEEITNRIYVTPLDILKLVPGISIQQYHQGGTASAFQMRGFTSCSHGPDAAIFLDGVPLNETDGYADTNIVIPEEIERVEVIKGPASALYGNYASAGVVHFMTIKSGDFTRFKARYGSFNTQDAVFSMARSDGKLDQVYTGQFYHTDGYQDNSDWDKQNASGRLTYHFNDKLSARVGMRFFNSTWDAPGYIPQPVYDSRPESAVSDVNGGEKKRVDGRVDVDYELNDSSKLMFYGWGYDQDFTRWYQNWISPSQQEGQNYGNERYFQRKVVGTGASYNYLGQIWGRDTSFVLGVDYMREDDDRERWYLTVGNGRNKGSKYQDYNIVLNTTSVYSELDYTLFQPLRMILGGRVDMFSGEMDDKMPSQNYDLSGPNIFSPKARLIYTVVPGWDVFANYGRGFALPTDKNLFVDDNLNPAIRNQYEVGLRAQPLPWAKFMVALWRLNTTDDIQASLDDPDQLENAGETRRQGVEVSADFSWENGWYAHADYSYIDSEYLDYISGGVQYAGNELRNVPHDIANFEAGYRPEQGFGGRLNLRYVSDTYIDSANTRTLDGYVVVNGQASYRFKKHYVLELDVVNLFDKKYSEYAGYTNGQMTYAPADPLSVYLTFRVEF